MSRDLRPFAQWPKPKSQVAAPVMFLGYLIEVAADEYEPTTDASLATHVHVIEDDGDIYVAPIEDAADVVRMRITGDSTVLLIGI